jgi:hypothetical protein
MDAEVKLDPSQQLVLEPRAPLSTHPTYHEQPTHKPIRQEQASMACIWQAGGTSRAAIKRSTRLTVPHLAGEGPLNPDQRVKAVMTAASGGLNSRQTLFTGRQWMAEGAAT